MRRPRTTRRRTSVIGGAGLVGSHVLDQLIKTAPSEQFMYELHESREAQARAQARYRGGTSSFLEDLDAQRTLMQAQRAQAESDSQLAVRLVAVFKALGASPAAAAAAH